MSFLRDFLAKTKQPTEEPQYAVPRDSTAPVPGDSTRFLPPTGGASPAATEPSASQDWLAAGSGAEQPWLTPTTDIWGPQQAGMRDELFDTLMGQMRQNPMPTRQDPMIRGQADAFSAQQTRAQRDYLADVAEKSGPYANLRGEERMAAERAGQASGAFEADLMNRELSARRNEIQQALQTMGNLLTADQRFALQRELQIIQVALQAEQQASFWDATRSGLI